ncbi:ribosomal protein S19 family protein [Staphylococcus epidermidis]|uniref:ribosomal protein S19 family protein n=1 Tax=Staphylococcus epidermidis TaxID=1282 RepID=UPI0011A94A7E|nr:ribosomal protein S19 family protein [Staphylococcus epidermidis]
MGGSIKKGALVDDELMKKVEGEEGSEKKEVIKRWCGGCRILGNLIGDSFGVYDGRKDVRVYVSEDMVGEKLGEFGCRGSFKGDGGEAKKRRR